MIAILRTGSLLGVIPSAAALERKAAPPAWVPHFLSTSQNETLLALGERIIPGTSAALCNRLIDSVLSIEAEKSKVELLQSLAAFDQEAHQLHHLRFDQLTPVQQDGILTIASRGGELHAEFGVVKEWMADAYWSSLNGLRELGWTGRMAWESFPDCGKHETAQLE